MLAKALRKENISQGVPVHGFPNPPGFAVGKIVFSHGPNYRGRLGMDDTAQPIWALFKPTKESNQMVTPVCIVDRLLAHRFASQANDSLRHYAVHTPPLRSGVYSNFQLSIPITEHRGLSFACDVWFSTGADSDLFIVAPVFGVLLASN